MLTPRAEHTLDAEAAKLEGDEAAKKRAEVDLLRPAGKHKAEAAKFQAAKVQMDKLQRRRRRSFVEGRCSGASDTFAGYQI